MSHLASIRALVLAVALVIVSATPAQAGTIVFDFEDGLQGWELVGAVQRVQTQLLSGEWAIFGDGFIEGAGSLSILTDLTDVASISVERFLIAGGEDELIASVVAVGGGAGLPPFEVVDPGNPNLLAIDVGSFSGRSFVAINWAVLIDEPFRVVAFIDNITFHTIPEPSVLVLLAMAGVAARARRRARGGRLT